MAKDSVSFLAKHFNDIPKELRLEALEGFQGYTNWMAQLTNAIQNEINLGIKQLLEIADINTDVKESVKGKLSEKHLSIHTLMFDHPNIGGLTYLTFKGEFVAGSMVTYHHLLEVVKRQLLTPSEVRKAVDQIKSGSVINV